MRSAVILCYHKVGPAAEEGRFLNVEPSRLASHASFFARRAYTFVCARDLAGTWPEKAVCFTFDDAYVSAMLRAPAILEAAGGRGSFYAVAGRVGQESDWDGERARPLADWDLLQEAQARGHEIGNHSYRHRRLGELTLDQQVAEISVADAELRAHGLQPGSFCFPYGSLGAPEAVAQGGYRVGLSLHKRIARESDLRLFLPRVVVAYSDSLPLLLYKIWRYGRR